MAEDAIVASSGGPLADDVWTSSPSVRVQGETLKTWDIGDEAIKRVQLSLKSDGRPIHSRTELWLTPSYVPTKFSMYTENGATRPINAIIETPFSPKTVAVYNTGPVDFPFDASVANTGLGSASDALAGQESRHVQGGQITSYTFGAEVDSVQILLKTTQRNMKAKIELTQGPNQVKQVIDVYASKYANPFYMVIETPGTNNAIRVINEHTVEFPFDATVLPYAESSGADSGPIMGGAGF